MWFNVNWKYLVINFTPIQLRKPALIGYVNALLQPIATLHYNWLRLRDDNLYKLEHTGQVCYLRKSLNDRFDPSLRRIYIGNGRRYPREYIYTRAEEKPRFLGTMYLRSRQDYEGTGVDFIVFVPGSIVDSQLDELKAHINFYKEGVKRYKIEKI
jgi:hypothetical protein